MEALDTLRSSSILPKCVHDPSHNSGPQEVLKDFLYLGAVDVPSEVLKEIGITHILTVVHFFPRGLPPICWHSNFTIMQVKVQDHPSEEIFHFFPACFEFIENAVSNGGKVFVHCVAGKSRSATVCIAFLMHHLKMSFSKALKTVRQARNCISPNHGFLRQLERFQDNKNEIPPIRQSLKAQIKFIKGETGSMLDPPWEWKCRNCLTTLFFKEDLSYHRCDSADCFFLEYPLPSPLVMKEEDTFSLECSWCGVLVGYYRWEGIRCFCKEWISPAFYVRKCFIQMSLD